MFVALNLPYNTVHDDAAGNAFSSMQLVNTITHVYTTSGPSFCIILQH